MILSSYLLCGVVLFRPPNTFCHVFFSSRGRLTSSSTARCSLVSSSRTHEQRVLSEWLDHPPVVALSFFISARALCRSHMNSSLARTLARVALCILKDHSSLSFHSSFPVYLMLLFLHMTFTEEEAAAGVAHYSISCECARRYREQCSRWWVLRRADYSRTWQLQKRTSTLAPKQRSTLMRLRVESGIFCKNPEP